MTTFWLLSVLMLLAAVLAVVIPLVNAQTKSGADPKDRPFNMGGALGVLIVVPVIALGLYTQLTNWQWDVQAPQVSSGNSTPSVMEMVAGLEQRLEREPDDLKGWRMLGRSYVALKRFPESVMAYKRAYELTDGQNADVLAEYGEALALSDQRSVTGEAGDLFEQALRLNPNNPKALYYGGMKAYLSEDKVTARERLSRLLALSPPEAVRQALEQIISEIDGPGAPPPQSAPADGGEAEATDIRLSLSVAPELVSRLNGASPLFVFARQAGVSRGPPLAVVRRQASELPLTLQLTDQDAMLPGTKLSSFDSLQLVARVSLGGTPQAQSGDLFGERQYSLTEGGDIQLVIDQVVP